MSDLVERVARALAGKYLAPSEGTYDTARDVIKAVADWLGADENSDLSWCAIEILLAQLEDKR